MIENNNLDYSKTLEDDSDATLINFDTINLENFTMQECTSASSELKQFENLFLVDS